jgi:hypothetical protein
MGKIFENDHLEDRKGDARITLRLILKNEVDETDSGMCSTAGFRIGSVESSGCGTRELVMANQIK